MRKILTLIALCFALCPAATGQIVINELMQSNIDCIMDDANEFPDSWIELYNPSQTAVNLYQYKLGLTNDPSEAFQLPSYTLAAQSLKLIYCDKEPKKGAWHAPFRLESGKGGSIYLFRNNILVDSIVSLKKQPAPNIAYGRASDGVNVWGYMLVPTPGNHNRGGIAEHNRILGDPVFSIPGQVFERKQQIQVSLSLPEGAPANATIRYTTDGSEPTETSSKYTTYPIVINSSKVIKAKLFCSSYLSPRAKTQSYLILGRSQTLPVISISTNKKYLEDNTIGIYTTGSKGEENANYKQDWRRPINIEFFEHAGEESVLNQLCETRIQGGASRGASLKSLALYAHKRFGEKRFDYEFFPEDRPEQTNYKSLLLRNAGNDFDYLYMRDAIIQRTMAHHTDVDWQAWRPAIVFINGVYKGIENIRERSNGNNIYTNYEGLEDVEVIENWWDVKTGDGSLFNDFVSFYTNQNQPYEEYDKRMDINEFMNTMIMELYFNNLDAPGNNFCIWRPTEDGGRWRVILKDVDYTMGLYGDPYNFKIFNWIYNPNYDSNHNWGANGANGTRLFRRLMANEKFKNDFIDRCCIYMGDWMNLNGVWEVWEPMYDAIKVEYPQHRSQINPWWPNYKDELNNAKTWLKNRTGFFYSHLQDYFQLSTPISLQINQDLSDLELENVKVSINEVPLSKSQFDGKMFKGRELRLRGENVLSWEVTTYGYNGIKTQNYSGEELTITLPDCSMMKIHTTLRDANGIDQIADTQNTSIELYQLDGTRSNHLQQGFNIIIERHGDNTTSRQKKSFLNHANNK